MSNELILALSGEVEHNDRYRTAPPAFTDEGARDRRSERRHRSAVREAERQAREAIVEAAVQAARDIAQVEARAKVRTEVKYSLSRAEDESDVIARGRAELRSKFAVIDDDGFREGRAAISSPRPSSRLFD